MSNPEKFNCRYEGLMRYYGVEPQHTNPARPHESGDADPIGIEWFTVLATARTELRSFCGEILSV